MTSRILNDAELDFQKIVTKLGCYGGTTHSRNFLKAKVEQFLETCHKDTKDPNFEDFAKQFCEQIDPEGGALFREKIWPEWQGSKPSKRVWSRDRESIIQDLADLFRTQVKVRRIEVREGRSTKSDFGRWGACTELTSSPDIPRQATLDECSEYLDAQSRFLDVGVVLGLDDQWLREKKPWPDRAIFRIERFMHSRSLYTTIIDLEVVRAVDSLIANLVCRTSLHYQIKSLDYSIYKELVKRCIEQVISSTAMMLSRGFLMKSATTSNTASTAQSLLGASTTWNLVQENSSETNEKSRRRKRTTTGSAEDQPLLSPSWGSSTSPTTKATIQQASTPHLVESPNYSKAWKKYPDAIWPAEELIDEARQKKIFSEISTEQASSDVIHQEHKAEMQEPSMSQRELLDEVVGENASRTSTRPPSKKKNTKPGVSRPAPWSPLEPSSSMFGIFPIKEPAHTSNLVQRGANRKPPQHKIKNEPEQVGLTEEMVPAEGLHRPDDLVKRESCSDTYRILHQNLSDTLEPSATVSTDRNISTRPDLVFTIQKSSGGEIKRSEPYEGHLLKEKTLRQFFEFVHAESLIVGDSLIFNFPNNRDEPRIMTDDKPGEDRRFEQLKKDIDDALDELKGKKQFKMEVTVPGVKYAG